MSQHLREEKPPMIEKLPTDKARLELPSFLPLIRLFSPHKQTTTIWRPGLSHLYLSQNKPYKKIPSKMTALKQKGLLWLY